MVIPIFNAVAGSLPPIPVNLDGDLPHIVMEFGESCNDNLVTPLGALVDTGAGCTLGNVCFFRGLVAQNPSILVDTFTCEGALMRLSQCMGLLTLMPRAVSTPRNYPLHFASARATFCVMAKNCTSW